MKLSARLIIVFLLVSGMPFSLVSASPSTVFVSRVMASSFASESKGYSEYSPESFSFLKWPRGSLIFPENNNPQKTNEVYLLNEGFIPPSELQSFHYHLGLQFFSRNQYNKAKGEYLKALEFKPDIAEIHKSLGLIYFNSKNYRKAERAYRKALQLEPGHSTILAKLALSLAAQKKYTLAEKKFKQAIRKEPSNADHHLNLGHFYFYLKKDYKDAKRSYQKALKFNPRLTKAKNNLRLIKRKFRKWKNQESDFENSWASDFDYDNPKESNSAQDTPSYPEEADIAGTWDEENPQRPLF